MHTCGIGDEACDLSIDDGCVMLAKHVGWRVAHEGVMLNLSPFERMLPPRTSLRRTTLLPCLLAKRRSCMNSSWR